ncbi:unnamed protein product [Adineta ricciae]|uniref:Uncharacterized protein n=1 Tax=Adineta ricciae TaxID=249248 RepID=A0A813RYA8_ADIRI|nr:unnamed protein product [Adineta ricciae]
MRLKTLRKSRPPLEIEGAILNGNRMDIINTDLRSIHHRSNTSFALPTSLERDISYPHLTSYDQMHDMSSHSFQDPDLLTESQSSNLSSYKAIQQAYLQHGIRIRFSPRKIVSATHSKCERPLTSSARPHTASARQNSAKPMITKQNQDHETESYDSPQQGSSNDFEQNHVNNISEEEILEDCYSTSFITSQHFHSSTPSEKTHFTNTNTPTTATLLDDDDPDMLYMSSLLKIASVESFRDANRRHGVVRRTFSARSYSMNDRSTSAKLKEAHERSLNYHTSSLSRSTTNPSLSTQPSNKIDSDIRKHVSRMQNSAKTSSTKLSGTQTTRASRASSRDMPITNNGIRRNSSNKSSKSMNLEPPDHILTPYQRTTSISVDDFPIAKTISMTDPRKRSAKHLKATDENQSHLIAQDQSTSPSNSTNADSLLMQTSPCGPSPRVRVFDSSWCERSNSFEGDGRSLSSSSVVHIPGSILSGQLPTPASRRTHKRVSFYEEPQPVVLTTTTFV